MVAQGSLGASRHGSAYQCEINDEIMTVYSAISSRRLAVDMYINVEHPHYVDKLTLVILATFIA